MYFHSTHLDTNPNDILLKQPGECGSTITTDFTLTKDLDCDCNFRERNNFALRIEGKGITLNLNGYRVTCPTVRIPGLVSAIIQVDGSSNTVQGPGLGTYTEYLCFALLIRRRLYSTIYS